MEPSTSFIRTFLLFLATILAIGHYVAAAPTSGCGQDLPLLGLGQAANGSSLNVNFTTREGTPRSYRIYIPSTYDTNSPAPIQLNYHGRGDTMEYQEALTGFSKPAYNKDIIQIYLQGQDKQWEGDPASKNVDDIAFTRQLLSDLASKYCIDDSRVFASGSSNGGGFVASQLLCSAWGSSIFAAGAPAYGAYYSNQTDATCTNGTYTPAKVPLVCDGPINERLALIEFHGDGDQTIPYFGGPRRGRCLPTVPHFVTEWAYRLGHERSNVSSPVSDSKGIVKGTRYEFGDDGEKGIVTHYRIFGWGHTWPTPGSGVDASAIIKAFFDKWVESDGIDYTGPDSVSYKLGGRQSSRPSISNGIPSPTPQSTPVQVASPTPSSSSRFSNSKFSNSIGNVFPYSSVIRSQFTASGSASAIPTSKPTARTTSQSASAPSSLLASSSAQTLSFSSNISSPTSAHSSSESFSRTSSLPLLASSSSISLVSNSLSASLSVAKSATSSTRNGDSSSLYQPTSVSSSVIPTASVTLIACPSANNTQYTESGKIFSILCDIDHPGYDLDTLPTYFRTFGQCVDACAGKADCQAVSYGNKTGNCYFKGETDYADRHPGVWAAKIVGSQIQAKGEACIA